MSVPVNLPKIFYTKIPTRQYNPNFTTSYILGKRIMIPTSSGVSQNIFNLTFSGSLIKFGIHMSSYNDGDYWNLSGSSAILCDTIYTKTVPESFVLEIGYDLNSGSDLIFDFYNTGSNAKTVWIDYYFIR